MSTPSFHELTVARVMPEAAGAVAVTFAVPAALHDQFRFEPGQFLTLRANIDGRDVRRSYSICSPRSRYLQHGELEVGIRAVEGGLFSNWAKHELSAGRRLQVLPPDGRFTVRRPRALHRVGFAAGSGITPILSIIASTMEESPDAKFTLVYGNRRMASVMFNEALQDLKDRYTDRLTLVHVLSRQAQEVPLLEGRIDGDKVRAIIATLLPVKSMDEVFICGPEGMIESAEAALIQAGVPHDRVHSERFTTADSHHATTAASDAPTLVKDAVLEVLLDGKRHSFPIARDERILDVALEGGLDLPYSCKAGVCCTCRARVIEGEVRMVRNFTLEDWEMKRGFVLSCQAVALGPRVVVSYDER